VSDGAVHIVTVTAADAPRWVELHRTILPTAPFEQDPSVEGIEEALGMNAARQWFLAEVDGRPAGLARTSSSSQSQARGAVYAFVAVAEELRGRGIGSALYRAVSAWAESVGVDALVSRLVETEERGLAWAHRRGFEEIERDAPRVLDLRSAPMPSVEPPPGVELTTLAEHPELLRGLYELALEAEPDAPGQEHIVFPPFEEWVEGEEAYWLRHPEAIFLATTPTEVVGSATLAPRSGGVALHGLTGVRRAWRGRGVARALKSAQIAWAKDAGYSFLETTNEVRNEPMQRLNASLGYAEQPAVLTIRGPLA